MSSSKWEEFFKYNPFFGPVSTRTPKINPTLDSSKHEEMPAANQVAKAIVLQRFWRKVTSGDRKIRIDPKSAHLPEQARLMANVRTDEEIKEILLHAAEKKQLNSNQVHTILSQKNALKCAYELHKEGKLTKDHLFRIVALHEKHGTAELGIEKSLNINKIKQLRKLIDNGLRNLNEKHDDPFQELKNLLKDPDFPQVVFGLFDSIYSEGLQSQQLITLLELYQAQKKRIYLDGKGNQIESAQPYITSVHRILDEAGNFTEEAKKYLLPSLVRKTEATHSFFMRGIDDNETYDQLKTLVSQLPASEQIFYTTVFPENSGLTLNVVGEQALTKINEYGPLSKVEDKFIGNPLLVPSCGVRNAIGLLRYGVEDYMPVIPQFGVKSMADIEKGIRKYHGRLAYLYYPHTPDPGNVHESALDTYIGVFAHDQYHSDIVSSIPQYARDGLLKFVDIIRNKTDIAWSEEIWIWVDADFRYFKTKEFDPQSANSVAHFCSMLDSVQLPFSYLAPYGQVIREKTGISPVGILVMLDMIKNKEEWKKIGINPDLLPDASPTRVPSTFRTGRKIHKPLDYKKYYERLTEMTTHYPEITTKSGACQLLETMTIFSQDKMPSRKEMVEFGEFADKLQKQGLLKIIKSTSNHMVLGFNGKNIIYQEGQESRQLQCISGNSKLIGSPMLSKKV